MFYRKITGCLTMLLLLGNPAFAFQEKVDNAVEIIQDKLQYSTPNQKASIRAGALVDGEFYYVDQRPPGLIFPDHSFFQHRGSLFVEGVINPYLYGFLQAKFDRGVDPGFTNHDVRLDEYFLRWNPLKNGKLNFQVGKSAMVVGNWVERHDSWNNPFINPPLVYENVTKVSDGAAPASKAQFLARRTLDDNKRAWLPVFWGPSYATGASVMGQLGAFDYAFEIKNASVSSRPSVWKASQKRWRDPTTSGRLGWRPSPAWNLGVSGSIGSYLLDSAQRSLPQGKRISDYLQVTVGQDFSYSRKKLQVWGEYYWSQFEVPFVGQANTFSYYLESKYKLNELFFIAARWNQQFFGDVEDGTGGKKVWDRDIFRIDNSLGYHVTKNIQAKAQYSYNHRKGDKQQGENLMMLQITLKI